ncbi:hypothetical protein CLOSTHATH_01391 [Hungatella hathewayi DSM 13479]|uniref:Uncharacterized protein n=1 Tax=Hungatella hathewayi DSM 13479 TaxID=566550 RepID=D3ACR3_9FIRM|nr:hypothetical protein CLOSTHATH_01391 [Hungatella hathewayi DSM 13479]
MKSCDRCPCRFPLLSHLLREMWIEIVKSQSCLLTYLSHLLREMWIEIMYLRMEAI